VPNCFTYQLRHSAVTEFRKRHGIEAAQSFLGHATLAATQIYADRDDAKAMAIIAEVG
jgi:site-specific recombinase XerC